MRLGQDERIVLIVYHHYMPFIYQVLQLIFIALPFYFGIYFLSPVFTLKTIILSYLILSVILLFIVVYLGLIYWLDKLIITNKRVIFIDWKYLTVKVESEASLNDIQDVVSVEKGILTFFPIFQYGTLIVKTASQKANVEFPQAPRPSILQKFITRIINL
jgi:hypothetical protein